MTGRASRTSVRFSADGALAACLVGVGEHWRTEVWCLGTGRSRVLGVATPETLRTQVLPLSADAALLIRHGAGRHELVALRGGPGRTDETLLTTVTAPGFRLLARPGRQGNALALTWDGVRTTVSQVADVEPWLRPVAAVAGVLHGGVPLDPDGRRFVFTRPSDGGGLELDLVSGTSRPLPGARPLLADPHSGLLLLIDEEGRLVLRHPDGRRSVPRAPDDLSGSVLPLAVEPGGRRIALRVCRGAGTRLVLHDVERDLLEPVELPSGVVGAVGAWSAAGLHVPFRAPTFWSGIVTVEPGTGRRRVSGADEPGSAHPAQAAHLERFPGPAGDIEAVVYGDWRCADGVVLALHGGPAAAWDLGYSPVLQHLAGAGLAVVAPNQRGSSGYGAAHADAIHDAWGGPDRLDVEHVGRWIRGERPTGARRPMLYGESYGAYLALLAAGHQPGLWSRCAVVAPFLSGARLHPDAVPAVRAMIERLGGRTALSRGANDVLTTAGAIQAPLLVVHGDADPTVPVAQARLLHDHLRRHAVEHRYLEVPGAGHDPHRGPRGTQSLDVLAGFLTGSPTP